MKWVSLRFDDVDFLVSENGDIKAYSEKKKKYRLLGQTLFNGYCLVGTGGSTYYAHRLVAMAFLGPIPEGCEIDHIDFDRSNNHYTNLQYLTHSENMKRSWREGRFANWVEAIRKANTGENSSVAVLDEDLVRKMRRLVYDKKMKITAVAERFGINMGTAYYAIKGRTWKHVKD